MKTIKVKYTDWWNGFKPEEYRIHKILAKYFNVEFSEEPDYVISSVYSKDFLRYDCVRILYTGENICPDFNLFDYGIGFEYLDFGDRYLRFPNWLMNPAYEKDVERMCGKHRISESEMDEKVEFCDFVYSNGKADPIREEMFQKLSGYKRVNSGGRFMNNMGMPGGVPNKYEFQRKHKFSIAFENSSQPGYTTEKLVQSFAAQTVPIYWGDPLVAKVFNDKAMIHVRDFSNLDEVVRRVMEVDQDEQLYHAMLAEPALLQKTGSFAFEFQELEDFLIHIFSQPKELAGRRNRGKNIDYYYGDWLMSIKNEMAPKENLFKRLLHGK